MSVQFKFHNKVGERRRRDVVKALAEAGIAAKCLFPGQKRPSLAAIFTVAKAEPKEVRAALGDYRADIEYVEGSPNRTLKASPRAATASRSRRRSTATTRR